MEQRIGKSGYLEKNNENKKIQLHFVKYLLRCL